MSSEMYAALERATNSSLVELDLSATLEIVDMIRQNDVSVKAAVTGILNRLHDKNPNIVLMTLQVLDYVVKNCGSAVHEEVFSRTNALALSELVTSTGNEDVKAALCLLLGQWCQAFRDDKQLRPVMDVVASLRADGFTVPEPSGEAIAMYRAQCAPEWRDGDRCYRCRATFTRLLNRKHHCRACGNVFCSDCSSKNSIIPKFGIEKEVRVCENCFDEINNPMTPVAKPKTKEDSSKKKSGSNGGSKSPSPDAKPSKSEQELKEEEELQLALALSKSEAENKEKEKLRETSAILGGGGWRSSAPPRSPSPVPVQQDAPEPELAKYLNRQYWETVTTTRSASPARDVVVTTQALVASPVPRAAEPSQEDEAVSDFSRTFKSQLEIFVNRMASNQSRGRAIAGDNAVQNLFVNITAMHGKLLQHLQHQDNKRLQFERLQDKLSQARDARAALDALRDEHREKEKREREEQQRIRQMQMQQKLEVMRKKKQEYLEYQRQLAVHRMAQTERQIMHQPFYPGSMQPQPHGDPVQPGVGYPDAMMPQYQDPNYHPMPGYMPVRYDGQNMWPPHGMPPHYMPQVGVPPGMQPHPHAMRPPGYQPHPSMMQPHLGHMEQPQMGHMPQSMGQPQPNMGQPQQTMGQPQQTMGQPQQNMGQPQQNMGQPQPNMGQPQPNMGQPQPNMGQPQPNMSQPQHNMGQPQQMMGQPQQTMGQPQPNMGQPQQNMGQPQPNMGQPQQPMMNQPQPNMGQPQPNMGQSQPNMGQPQPNMGQPQPNMGQMSQPMMNQPQPMMQHHMGQAAVNQGGGMVPQPQPQQNMGQPQQEVELISFD